MVSTKVEDNIKHCSSFKCAHSIRCRDTENYVKIKFYSGYRYSIVNLFSFLYTTSVFTNNLADFPKLDVLFFFFL